MVKPPHRPLPPPTGQPLGDSSATPQALASWQPHPSQVHGPPWLHSQPGQVHSPPAQQPGGHPSQVQPHSVPLPQDPPLPQAQLHSGPHAHEPDWPQQPSALQHEQEQEQFSQPEAVLPLGGAAVKPMPPMAPQAAKPAIASTGIATRKIRRFIATSFVFKNSVWTVFHPVV